LAIEEHMLKHSVAPLKSARIWLSGSIPDQADPTKMKAFIAGFADQVFRAGGSIVHGSQPAIWPILVERAAAFQAVGGSRDCLTLAVSSRYTRHSAQRIPLDEWRQHAVVQEVPATDEIERQSLDRLRSWMADRSDAVVLVGGNWWDEHAGRAGVPIEFELARERGLPSFLLGGFGGAVAGYLDANPEILDSLKNGLDETTNREIAIDRDPDRMVDVVLAQLLRLPLVRGEPAGGASFRILALDGGGIKGTFTAAALAEWERLTHARIADHFDLVAGTSTGGILALGLGMGLEARDILSFYETRGAVVFPLTSLRRKARYWVRSLFQPKFPQEVLRQELKMAFAQAPRRTMHESICRLVIPACHARTGAIHLFRTNHHPDLAADRDRVAIDVALATAAAPTYFRAAEVNGQSYVDGGVWANNPVMAAIVEAVSRLRIPLNHVDILSVGTTSEPYSGRHTLRSGLAGWAWQGRIITLLMHAQQQATSELAGTLAGRARLLRVDQTLVPGEVSLDKVASISDLRDYGREAAGHPDIVAQIRARFVNGVPANRWDGF
jgi:patatin-like phospholipase/acyl hydrolase